MVAKKIGKQNKRGWKKQKKLAKQEVKNQRTKEKNLNGGDGRRKHKGKFPLDDNRICLPLLDGNWNRFSCH